MSNFLPVTWYNSAPTGGIFVTYVFVELLKIILKIHVFITSDKITGGVYEDIGTFNLIFFFYF
jgi:hypothetical protein